MQRLSLLLCALLVGACTVGEAYGDGDGDGSGNGNGNGNGNGDGADAGQANADGCDEPITAGLNSGEHNPGQGCMNAGCHDGGGGAPEFTIGGTLFDGLGSNTPVAGATIHLIDGGGNDVTLITSRNGNFYSEDAFTFPLTTNASRCPDLLAMVAQVQAADGNCNKGGCHVAGNRIYLPPL